ncbi:MAG: methyltransferase domain-containing protein [Planctomycetota bacterium]|jgi:SAM-dependent methyltransferase
MTDFYDHIADEYDQIVQSTSRAPAIRAFAQQLTGRWPIRTALDVAAGAGAYACALAEAGAETTAIDLSEAMVQRGRDETERKGLVIQWRCGPMQEVDRHVSGRFDAIVCMGNSLPHLLDAGDLARTFDAFASLLADDGVVVAGLLNYHRILAETERIVGISRSGDVEYVRFYDFLDDLVRFNILRIEWQGGKASHQLNGTLLRPYRAQELAEAAQAPGLEDVTVFGSLAFEPFDEAKSDVVVVTARKG